MTQANVSVSATPIFAAMSELSKQRVVAMTTEIKKAIALRTEYERETRTDGLSADHKEVLALDTPEVAKLFLACGVKAGPYINAGAYDQKSFPKASGLAYENHTQNLKAYKKMREIAGYLNHGTKLERVVQVIIACSIVASQYKVILARDVCENFIANVGFVSDEIAEAIAHYRQPHHTGGAKTQFSQVSLTLSAIRAGHMVGAGQKKDFCLNLESPVTEAFAMRFGLTAELDKAKAFRAKALAA